MSKVQVNGKRIQQEYECQKYKLISKLHVDKIVATSTNVQTLNVLQKFHVHCMIDWILVPSGYIHSRGNKRAGGFQRSDVIANTIVSRQCFDVISGPFKTIKLIKL